MNPYARAVSFVLRLIAFAFILFGALQLGAEYVASRQNKTLSSPFWLFLEVLSLIVGLLLLFKSGAIARKLTEDLEE